MSYRILLNHVTVIKFSTTDKDGDFVQCEIAKFITAGGLPQLRNTTVYKVSNCSLVFALFIRHNLSC